MSPRKRLYVTCPRCGRAMLGFSGYEPMASHVIKGGERVCEKCAAKACIEYVIHEHLVSR